MAANAILGLAASLFLTLLTAKAFARAELIGLVWLAKPFLEVGSVCALYGFYLERIRAGTNFAILAIAVAGYASSVISLHFSVDAPFHQVIDLLVWAIYGVPGGITGGFVGYVASSRLRRSRN